MGNRRVIAFIRGGIGNQMFIYAAARSVALRNDASLILTTDSFDDQPHNRQYLLGNFNLAGIVGSINDPAIAFSRTKHLRARKANRYYQALSSLPPHYAVERTKNVIGKHQEADKRFLNLQVDDFVFIDGHFQNEFYFADHADAIRSDFRFATPLSDQTLSLATQIVEGPSVCLHFRRTELEQTAMREKHGEVNWLKRYREGLGADYYRDALEIIEQQVPSAKYFCFSDFPDWVKQNIDLPVPMTYITHNNSQATCHEDMYLMSKCRHHVISHSTFGWWGAWLAESKGQIVIAPRNIIGRPKAPYYPQRWNVLDVRMQHASIGFI